MEPIVFWIIVGIIAGMLAKMVVPGEGLGGVLGDLILGVMSALVGGWLFHLVLGANYSGGFESTLAAFVSACLLLFTLRTVMRCKTDDSHPKIAVRRSK